MASLIIMASAAARAPISDAAFRLYGVICTYAHQDSDRGCFRAGAALAAEARLSESGYHRARRELLAARMVRSTPRFIDGRQSTNVLVPTAPSEWAFAADDCQAGEGATADTLGGATADTPEGATGGTQKHSVGSTQQEPSAAASPIGRLSDALMGHALQARILGCLTTLPPTWNPKTVAATCCNALAGIGAEGGKPVDPADLVVAFDELPDNLTALPYDAGKFMAWVGQATRRRTKARGTPQTMTSRSKADALKARLEQRRRLPHAN